MRGENLGLVHEDQNSVENLRLLAAQRHLYDLAKRYRVLNWSISLGVAIVSVIVINVWPGAHNSLVIIGVAWTVISMFALDQTIQARTKGAASVQELLDTKLFQLPWKSDLVGDKPEPELIANAARKYRFDPEHPLNNWYAAWSNADPATDSEHWQMVLSCQRENLTWDWRLRREFARVVLGTLVAGLIVELGDGCLRNISLLHFLEGYVGPSLSVYLMGLKSFAAHMNVATLKEAKAREIQRTLDQSLSLTVEKCRDVQDAIRFLESYGAGTMP